MNANFLPDAKTAAEHILNLDNIIIFTHERPDGDAIGSAFALQKALQSLGKEADIFFSENLPHRYAYLINENTYVTQRRKNHVYSCCIALDCGNFERLESFDKGKALNIPIINIDHHADNTLFGGYNYINPKACATAEIIFDILTSGQWEISKDIADCLLIGILLDTGGLRFANTNANVLKKAAALIEYGADYTSITKDMYFTTPLEVMILKSDAILNHMKIMCNGKFAYLYLNQELMDKYKVSYKDTEGLIDYIRTVQGLIIAAVISKAKDGFRISLRSNFPDYPVNIIAREISGGGGHRLAAGCTINTNNIEEAEKILLEKVSLLLA